MPRADGSLTVREALEEEYVAVAGPLPADYDTKVKEVLSNNAAAGVEAAEASALAYFYRTLQPEACRSALCLSGGGIRSATFALGLLQGLAKIGVLQRFTYLSTVSGGGYIGSWLSAWIKRDGTGNVVNALGCGDGEPRCGADPKPVHQLRRFSNYLSPRMGMLSADTWTLAGIFLRNLLVNWLLLIPLLATAVLLPRLAVAVVSDATWAPTPSIAWSIPGLLLLLWAVAVIAISLPGGFRPPAKSRDWLTAKDEPQYVKKVLLPLVWSAVALTTWWWWYAHARPEERLALAPTWFLVAGLGLHLLAWVLYLVMPSRRPPANQETVAPQTNRLWSDASLHRAGRRGIAAVASGLLGGLLVWVAAIPVMGRLAGGPAAEAVYVWLAMPLFLACFLLAATLFVALDSRDSTDQDREWEARAGSWVLIVIAAWLVIGFLTLFGPTLLVLAWERTETAVAACGLSGVASALFGLSRWTSGPANGGQGRSRTTKLLDRLALAGALVFLACLASALSLLISVVTPMFVPDLASALATAKPIGYWLLGWVVPEHSPHMLVLVRTTFGVGVELLLALAVVLFLAAMLVDINVFSLHGMYRDRLIRAYLGASNAKRDATANRFTDFDEGDNLRMRALRPERPGAAPFHVVNMALNLSRGGDLAWQERKAESFTATPLHAGAGATGYRRLEEAGALYGGPEGISLGTVMAISGAAANPNMGYHSSPILTFLMTLFNVRLGAWLGNPSNKKTFQNAGPRLGLRPLICEALGLTDKKSPYVNLSDGGHFDNLGLYEMVRRRCRLIVVSDAGCDPGCDLEDLGKAVAKIRVDFGVPIEFEHVDIQPREARPRENGERVAVARIRYSAVDGFPGGPAPEAVDGVLIYLKPALLGDEPADVRAYAISHSQFPHESTGDQWFSETQFECYRALGRHTAARLWPSGQPPESPLAWADFIRRAAGQFDGKPAPEVESQPAEV